MGIVASATALPSAAVDDMAAFGDSITAGSTTAAGNGCRCGGYEPPLEALLGAVGRPARIFNWGLPGERSFQGVGRLTSVLNAVPNAKYVLLKEGANDVYEGISPPTTAANMGLMIDKVKSLGKNAVLGTVTPNSNGFPPGANTTVIQINGFLANVAKNRGVPLADHYGAVIGNWFNLSIGDGLHPNQTGYNVMAQTWFDTLTVNSGPPDEDGGPIVPASKAEQQLLLFD